MSTSTLIAPLWAVLDSDDRVLLVCSGADSDEVVGEWLDRGYRVQAVPALAPLAVAGDGG